MPTIKYTIYTAIHMPKNTVKYFTYIHIDIHISKNIVQGHVHYCM